MDPRGWCGEALCLGDNAVSRPLRVTICLDPDSVRTVRNPAWFVVVAQMRSDALTSRVTPA